MTLTPDEKGLIDLPAYLMDGDAVTIGYSVLGYVHDYDMTRMRCGYAGDLTDDDEAAMERVAQMYGAHLGSDVLGVPVGPDGIAPAAISLAMAAAAIEAVIAERRRR